MTQYLSDKLRVLSLVSIIFVLYIHSGFHADEIEGMVVNDHVQEFISGMMGRCAVPMFYIISGFLFFLKVPDGMVSIFGKMRKRVRTLLIPYIIGCLFCIGFGVAVALMPGTSRYMNSTPLSMLQKPIGELLCGIFYDQGNGAPYAFQLWFLRDLILIVATSPLWYLCLKRLGWLFVAIMFGLTYIQVPHVPIYPLFWFAFGGQLVKLESLIWGGRITMLTSVLFLTESAVQLSMPDLYDWELVRVPVILLGIVSLWGIYDMVVGKEFELSKFPWLATACGFTFFIYLFHEPTLNIVRKLIVAVLGKNEFGYLTSYLISPWIFTASAVMVGLLFRKYVPTVYRVCTGGR